MNTALWIAQGLLAAAFLMAGLMKVVKSKEELSEQMGWVDDFSEGVIKAIGGLEIVGAVGLILPGITGIAPVLVPLAAVGLGLTQVGAIVVHGRRSEMQNVVVSVILLGMSAFVTWGRFGDYSL
jgi:uncharacterized membrane protein YphA (DoxX/SURF4 family)